MTACPLSLTEALGSLILMTQGHGYGWPSEGGVWVLHTTVVEATKKGTGLIHSAYNMEERCKVIKQMGGFFHADPKNCPYLDLL